MGADAPVWEDQQNALKVWLSKLPRPVGVMACNDSRGQHVLDACRRVNLAVPEEVAVIGVDNDELICNLCDPQLSSVVVNARKIGFEAAQMLDLLMAKKKIPRDEILVEPIGIITRQSTDVLAIDNPEVATAVRFIREHACEGISVSELLTKVNMTRSVLERLFRKYLQRSPQQEIRLAQLKRVKELLAETELPLADIAQATGFKHNEYLSVLFKRELGITPGEYRRSVQPKLSSQRSLQYATADE
jgi:LacI family transcriptional regulator